MRLAATLLVRACGPATSLQDRGRFGYQRLGISPSGAMDLRALALANALVGNAPDEGAIEFGLVGGEFVCEHGPVRVGLAGAAMRLAVDGVPAPPLASLTLRPEQILRVEPASAGVFGYLAVAGGLAVPPELGGISLHRRAGIGGLGGRGPRAGDRLALRGGAPEGPERRLGAPLAHAPGPIRVVLGPQEDYFSPESLACLLEQDFRVSARGDRMAYRLEGPTIRHAKGYNIVSDGAVAGSIQVPGGGEPLVLLADRQTTGGYPKIATVISADLPRFAQTRAGESVRFAAIGVAEAVAAARAAAAVLAAAIASIEPLPLDWTASDWLLSHNLVGGVSGAE